MRQNRYLGVILSLVLLIGLILPSAVFADKAGLDAGALNGKLPPRSTPFTAEAQVYISSAGISTVVGQHGPLISEQTVGEVISGQVLSSLRWPELEGATFTMDCVSNDAVLNMKSLTLLGKATGTITLIGADQSSVMKGTFRAVIRGKFYLDESGQPVFYQVEDSAAWELNGTGGVFVGTTARGEASVTLTPITLGSQTTLGGLMQLRGVYR